MLARLGDARRRITTGILRLARIIERVVLLLQPLLLPLPVHRPVVHGKLRAYRVGVALHVVRPATEASGIDANANWERTLCLVLRHREKSVDPASERRERDAVEVELGGRTLFDEFHGKVERNFLCELLLRLRPELVEVCGRGTALLYLLRLERSSEDERLAFRTWKLKPQKTRAIERSRNRELRSLCDVDSLLRDGLRPEVVERHFLLCGVAAQVCRVEHGHGEGRGLAAAIYASRLVRLDLVGCRKRRESGEERKRSERPFHHDYFAFIV